MLNFPAMKMTSLIFITAAFAFASTCSAFWTGSTIARVSTNFCGLDQIRPFSPPAPQYKSTPEDTSYEDEDRNVILPQADTPPPGAPLTSEVLATTMKWMKKTVIGLNLCPFAERPLKTKELSFHVVRGDDPQTIAEAVAEQLLRKRDEKGTALVICPDFNVDDFEEYMAAVQFLEERVMVFHDLHGSVQIAAFHPEFTFDGSGDNVDVFTNRSPYPMFHVLREDEVGRAVMKLGGDPGKVWRRNKRLLEILEDKLGRLRVVKLLSGRGDDDKGDDMDDASTEAIVEESLQQTKNEMEKDNEEGQEKNFIRGFWVR